jgi:serine/threonine protein phosphatase 1
MKKRWVIPDIHGCARTLQALIEELIRPERFDELYFLGDYIDRGPDSKGVIDYIRKLQKEKYPVTALKGNHEEVLIDLYDAEMRSAYPWFHNFLNRKRMGWFSFGGKATLKSFGVKNLTDIHPEYIEWLRGLEYFVALDKFILVHAGFNFRKEDPFEDKHAMMWVRDYEIKPDRIGNRRIIHGHVPVNLELINLSVHNSYYKFIDLDNGPYMSGKDGFGNLVALELESMEMVIQNNVDS